ncbi:MAG TPA: hypothetical protein VF277_06415 [Steroidobacteraceae bacterium]
MNIRASGRTLFAIAMAIHASDTFSDTPPADSVPVEKDLAAVIALQGLPCGQVVTVRTLGDNDYVATCQDGNRYHVFINADGRVVAEKK